jgi:hypothetical protein
LKKYSEKKNLKQKKSMEKKYEKKITISQVGLVRFLNIGGAGLMLGCTLF